MIAALALAMSGCASSSLGGGDASSGPGDTVKVMMFNSGQAATLDWSPAGTAVSTYVDAYLNPAGGVHGRQVELTVCDDQLDPNKAAACAQRAVTEGVVAVIGGMSINGNRFLPGIEAAGIPYVVTLPLSSADYTSPVSFPMQGGTVLNYSGAAAELVRKGCPDVGLLVNPIATSAALEDFARKGADAAGGRLVSTVAVPVGTTDMSAAFAKLKADGADCVVIGTVEQDFVNFANYSAQSGSPIPLSASTGGVPPQALKALSAEAVGQLELVGGSYGAGDRSIAEIQQYADLLSKTHPDAPIEDKGAAAWGTAAALFAAMASVEGDLTPAAIATALARHCPVGTEVYGPDVCFDAPATSNPSYRRTFNANLFVYEVGEDRSITLVAPPAAQPELLPT
ncbi:ABC transporter substrate-binding protein [Pseudonocardia xishanensis]|uniref:Leucine-binding protein domain-containing protein n=1 Tax=Pseudonocardia xishanensis TaxID=630995 RepID=A0ABP8RV23_9PSEU